MKKKYYYFLAAAILVVPASVNAQLESGAEAGALQREIMALMAQVQVLQTKLLGHDEAVVSTPQPELSWTRDLSHGARGEDVRALQRFLNGDPRTQVAPTGVGSSGHESDYFGPRTKEAVRRLQELHASSILTPVGLARGSGYMGVSTRSFMMAQVARSTKMVSLQPKSIDAIMNPTEQIADAGTPQSSDADGVLVASNARLTIVPIRTASVVPRNAGPTTFSRFILRAPDEPIAITSLTMRRTGLGNNNDFDKVWVEYDERHEGDTASLLGGGEATVVFRTPLLVTGVGHTLSLRGSLASNVPAFRTYGLSLHSLATSTKPSDIAAAVRPQFVDVTFRPASTTLPTLAPAEQVPGIASAPIEAAVIEVSSAVWLPVARLRFAAQFESIKLTDLYLANAPSGNLAFISSAADGRVRQVGLFDEAGTLKGTGAIVNGRIHIELGKTGLINGYGPIIVGRNENERITVAIRTNPINRASQTGAQIKLVVDTTQSGGAKGESATTGIAIGTFDVDATDSELFVIRKGMAELDVIAQQGSDQTLSDGSGRALYRFIVKAHSSEDIGWKAVKFDITGRLGGLELATTTGATTFSVQMPDSAGQGFVDVLGEVSVTAFSLYEENGRRVGDGRYTVQLDWDGIDNNGEIAIIMNDGVEEIVAAGSEKRYELRAKVSGANSSGDYVGAYIDNEADDKRLDGHIVTGDPDSVDGDSDDEIRLTANAALMPYSFLWADYSATPHSAATVSNVADGRDWTNDRFLRVDEQSWVKQ